VAIVPDQSSSAVDEDFGANDWLLEEMYEQYSADPSSVDETWAKYFQTHGAPNDANGKAGQRARAAAGEAAPRPSLTQPAQPRRAVDQPRAAAPAPAPAQTEPKATPAPAAQRPEAISRRPPTVERPAPSKDSRPTSPGARGGVPADPPDPANRPNVSL
jgi:multifunctional 2-oxoglutarate metabolism enzyme